MTTSPYKYVYFVSYSFSNSRYESGFGHTTVNRTLPLRTSEDVFDVAETIRIATGSATIIILNFQLLSTTEEPQS